MKLINRIKGINRALLEIITGIIFLGVVCHLIGVQFVQDKSAYGIGLWIGIVMAIATACHMYRMLNKALDLGMDASKFMISANMIRYVFIVMCFAIIMITDKFNPLYTFLGIMTLKVAAYLQPFTHKLYNKVFNETDPIPQPMLEEEFEDEFEEMKEEI